MDTNDLKNYVSVRMGVDFSDPQLDKFVEAARMMVFSADGKHIWENLRVRTTLDLVANTAEYTFPPDGSNDPKISKLVYVEKQAETDTPIKIYGDEEAAETEFVDELGGVVRYPHDEDGKTKLLFKLTPKSAVTVNIGYRKQAEPGLGFVKSESHDVFLFACDVLVPIRGVPLADAYNIRAQNYALYKDRLEAAIANDYTATQEFGRTFSPVPARQLQDTFATFQGDR